MTFFTLFCGCINKKTFHNGFAENRDTLRSQPFKILSSMSDTINTVSENKIFVLLSDSIYEADEMFFTKMKVYQDNNIIWSDTDVYLYTNTTSKTIYVNDSISYIITKIFDPISARNTLILQFTMDICTYQILVYGDTILDIDNDGTIDIIGHEYTDAVCMDCDSCYYSPFEVYCLGNNLRYNDTLSQILTKLKYNFVLDVPVKDTISLCNNVFYNNVYLE